MSKAWSSDSLSSSSNKIINKNRTNDCLDSKSKKLDYFNRLIESNEAKNATNSFNSDNWHVNKSSPLNKINKNDPTYGIPTNEKTFKRGVDAHIHIENEVKDLLQIIRTAGDQVKPDDQARVEIYEIKFKKLFDIYVNISNKLVGLLIRARKHGYIHFEGECLFQSRDDHVIIKTTHKQLI